MTGIYQFNITLDDQVTGNPNDDDPGSGFTFLKNTDSYGGNEIHATWMQVANEDNHDTVTLLALDKNGNLAAGSSTSGLRYKLNGRVGDSPIVGSGIFVDNSIGAAGATGQGEEIMQTVGSFLIVEQMAYTPVNLHMDHTPQTLHNSIWVITHSKKYLNMFYKK